MVKILSIFVAFLENMNFTTNHNFFRGKAKKILRAEAELKQNINEVGSETFDLNTFLSMMSRKTKSGGGNDIFYFLH